MFVRIRGNGIFARLFESTGSNRVVIARVSRRGWLVRVWEPGIIQFALDDIEPLRKIDDGLLLQCQLGMSRCLLFRSRRPGILSLNAA